MGCPPPPPHPHPNPNPHPTPSEARCEQYGIRNLRLRHVRGDPRSRSEMQRLIDVRSFKAAIVVCGERWGAARLLGCLVWRT